MPGYEGDLLISKERLMKNWRRVVKKKYKDREDHPKRAKMMAWSDKHCSTR